MKRSLGAVALAATTVLAVPATVFAHGSVYQSTAFTGAALTLEQRYFVTNHGFSYILKESNGITDASGADARKGMVAYNFAPSAWRSPQGQAKKDFATVMNLIRTPPTAYPGGGYVDPDEQANILPAYVNHAFDFQNRSNKDLLIKPWIPPNVAGLTGVDFGLRTYEKATIALEVVFEVTDQGTGRVRDEGGKEPLLPPTEEIITVGVSGPAADAPAM